MSDRPAISWRTFARADFIRVPAPAARTMAVTGPFTGPAYLPDRRQSSGQGSVAVARLTAMVRLACLLELAPLFLAQLLALLLRLLLLLLGVVHELFPLFAGFFALFD